MKKILLSLALASSVLLSTNAQNKEKRERMSVAQKTELAVKKMTLKLDLTESQQRQIKPLLAEKISKRAQMHEQRKAMKEKKQRPTADERYKAQADRLDEMIAFKADMKRILNKEQFEKFEKGAKRKKGRNMRKMKKRRKHEREDKRD